MAHLRQHPPFVNDGGSGAGVLRILPAEELQGHLSIEPRVPGPVNLAKAAFTNLLQPTEHTPRLQRLRQRLVVDHHGAGALCIGMGPAIARRRHGVVHFSDLGDQLQVADEPPHRIVDGTRLGRRPIGRDAVERRTGKLA